jgi:molybdopterin/thiamine biosynthesis adenylyltransferase/rhodanese-related sulfurtransferase
MAELSSEELKRYARHLALPSFGRVGQQKLKHSKVLVIGAGGLGSPLLLYLAAAGIGKIGIVEFDHVDRSNLQRQVLYTEQDVGQPKVLAAAKRLKNLNPLIEIDTYNHALTSENALELVNQYDIIADGTDNFPTRYLVNDACLLAGKPYIYGSIYQFEGQVSVFNYLNEDGSRGPNYRDLFPTPPPPHLVPNCAEGGVIGVLPGIIGSLQANEVIKLASGVGDPLVGKLFLFDASTMFSRIITIKRRNDYEVTALIDYEQFCNPSAHVPVPEMSIKELKLVLKNNEACYLIDVREQHEREHFHIGGVHIPLRTIDAGLPDLPHDSSLVCYCQSGKRSAEAVRVLQRAGVEQVYNLAGGVEAWLNDTTD